jgi:mannose-6-phosphate isomerase-like protein (cupin superfamily)
MRCRKEIMRTDEEKFETSATLVAPGEGSESLLVFGELVVCKITSYQTGGAYSLFEVVTHPRGGPPPHVQHREDEAFWVLEGEYEFLVEGRITNAGAGSLVYVPRGNLHAHKNAGDEPGRLLVSQTPGGLYERFLEEVGEPARGKPRQVSEGPAGIEKIAEIAAEYGIEISLTPNR